jgi:hypothetical protein
MNGKLKQLQEFTICVDKSSDVEDLLKNLGYEKRCGSCTYQHHYFWVVPFKKWYYPMEGKCNIYLSVEEFRPDPIFKLKVETR